MMVDPRWIYEEKLKGKTPNQIRVRIRSLQRKIHHLQKIVANPEKYPREWKINPSPEVQLEVYRVYLQNAREVLMDTIEYLCGDKS